MSREYWIDRPLDESVENSPVHYAKITNASRLMVQLIHNCVGDLDAKIFEVGCGPGRNLWGLQELGHNNLSGIDVNKNAVAHSKVAFPELKASITCAALEWTVPLMGVYDVIFAVAALHHMPTESENAIRQLAAKTRKWLIVLEDEKSASPRHFPRNYEALFGSVIPQVKVIQSAEFQDPAIHSGYVCRVFQK